MYSTPYREHKRFLLVKLKHIIYNQISLYLVSQSFTVPSSDALSTDNPALRAAHTQCTKLVWPVRVFFRS